jgi:hypothetical protein
VWPDGEHFRVTDTEADVIVADDLGELVGRKNVKMKQIERNGERR